MKKGYVSLAFALLFAGVALAQNVTTATRTIDKQKIQGLQISLNADKKLVESLWKEKLNEFGNVEVTRNTWRVQTARMPALSSTFVRMATTLESAKDKTVLFWAIETDKGYLSPVAQGYATAEQSLKDFALMVEASEQVQLAEKELAEETKKQEKTLQAGEKLQKDIERNKSEAESLARRTQANKLELEELNKNAEANKVSYAQTATIAEQKRKNVEAAREKLSKVKKVN